MYAPTLKSAIAFSNEGKLEEWIHQFLHGEGKNESLSSAIRKWNPKCVAPQMINLGLLRRIHEWKPEKYAFHGERKQWFWNQVDAQVERYNADEWDIPPLMAVKSKSGDTYDIFDGNHRLEALKKLGMKEYWVIVFDEQGQWG